MFHPARLLLPFLLLAGTSVPLSAVAADRSAPRLRTFYTPYYTLYTDLDDEGAREAWIRMTRMFEEYKRRTAGFSGELREKFPFYLYKNADDYYAAGGPPDSAGVFTHIGTQGELRAIAGEHPTPATWHTVQHEGFHQFAAGVIQGDMPPWVNEGLAEYFGEAIFTGDGYVAGVIPPRRLARLQQQIRNGEFRSLRDMMTLSNRDWNEKLDPANYDQAWSMVHFLAHGDESKYQKAFVDFMNQLGRKRPYLDAWRNVFGQDMESFQKRWQAWWLGLPPSPTATLYRKAVLLTLTSYYARSYAQGQRFADFAAFAAAAQTGKLKISRDDWLPPTPLQDALEAIPVAGTFSVEFPKTGGLPRLRCKTAEGAELTAAFALSSGRVSGVTCEVVPPASTRPATTR